MFGHASCKVFPTQVVIPGGSSDLHDICFYGDHRHIKGASAQIEYQDIPPACIVMSKLLLHVSQSSCCGLIDNAENLQSKWIYSLIWKKEGASGGLEAPSLLGMNFVSMGDSRFCVLICGPWSQYKNSTVTALNSFSVHAGLELLNIRGKHYLQTSHNAGSFCSLSLRVCEVCRHCDDSTLNRGIEGLLCGLLQLLQDQC